MKCNEGTFWFFEASSAVQMVMVIETITVLYEEIDHCPQTTMPNKIHYWRDIIKEPTASQPASHAETQSNPRAYGSQLYFQEPR